MRDRNETIKIIRTALRRRSGKPWSVTGGHGTAWGWLRIDAPPARRTFSFEGIDQGERGHYMGSADRGELATLLGLEKPVHMQGEQVPSGSDYWEEYVDRAEGRTPAKYGEIYWD